MVKEKHGYSLLHEKGLKKKVIFFSAFERMVAWRYLFARYQKRFVSVMALFSFLGILLGVATLIVVMSVMNGFRHELLGRILGFNGHITLYNHTQHSWDSSASLPKKIQDIPGVISVTPLVERQVMVMGVRGAVARGMAISDLKTRLLLSQNIRDGSLDLQSNEIVIGAKLAQRLGLSVGSEISLMAPEGTVTAIGTVPRVRKFRIGAVFEMGMSEYDSVYIFLAMKTAQQFFRMGSDISGLEVFVQNTHQVHEQEAAIVCLKCLGGISVHVVNWQKANANFFRAIQVERRHWLRRWNVSKGLKRTPKRAQAKGSTVQADKSPGARHQYARQSKGVGRPCPNGHRGF